MPKFVRRNTNGKFFKGSYKRALAINFTLVAVLPLLVFGAVIVGLLTKELERDAAARNLTLARSLASEVEVFLNTPENELRQIAHTLENGFFPDDDWLNSYLFSLTERHSFFKNIQILDKKGMLTHIAPYDEHLPEHNMCRRPFVEKVLRTGDAYWSVPFPDIRTGFVTLTLSIPFEDGIVLGYIKLELLSSIIKRVRAGGLGYAFMTDDKGRVIVHPDKSVVIQGNKKHPDVTRQGLTCKGSDHPHNKLRSEHIESSVKIPKTGWSVTVTQAASEAYAIAWKTKKLLWAGTMIALALSIGLSLWNSDRILKPLLSLSVETQKIAEGRHVFISPAGQPYLELATLARNFSMMAKAVKARENELNQVKNYLDNIIDSMPSVLIGLDVDAHVTHWNFEAEKVTGVLSEKAKGRPIKTVFPQLSEHLDQVRRAMISGEPQKAEKVRRRMKGEMHYFDVMVYPLVDSHVQGIVLRIDDVTARIRLEQMMVQTEKMMSVGGLAAGMAHEINNPLGGILQSVQNISRRISPELDKNVQVAQELGISLDIIRSYMESRNILRHLDGIQKSGRRAANIVANMLNFSRRSESRMVPTRLSDLLNRTVELAAHDYDLKKKYDFRHIRIIREFVSDLPQVPCVATEIEQVILNLIRNAAQAMEDKKDGQVSPQITLRLYKDADMACIEVEDNGPGMDEGKRKRIFEPFFTTKAVGVGTGLGLSVSYFIIVTNHRGTMRAESEPGKGARFIIHLPL